MAKSKDSKWREPDEAERQRRKIIGIKEEAVTEVDDTKVPSHWPGENGVWTVEEFRKNFQVRFHHNKSSAKSRMIDDACFSLIGLDASISNAFRRILISEIPTLAIADVFVMNNNSVIHDEVLAQRLGLIPFTGSRQGFDWMTWSERPREDDQQVHHHNPTDQNTVVLKLWVECKWKEPEERHKKMWLDGNMEPEQIYENSNVYAKDIEFLPSGRQADIFTGPGAIRPVNPGILIAKLRPGQKIFCTMHAVKGIGKDHAKFSPVCTASYRLLPTIEIHRPILGEDAKKFIRCFPRGVIGLEKVSAKDAKQKGSGYEGHEGEEKAVVLNTMKDTVSRECLRHDEFKEKVKLGRVRDHFIFSIESTGQISSDELFMESIKILRAKCERFQRHLKDLQNH